jgi:3-hydroxy-D-aspartate aldolase
MDFSFEPPQTPALVITRQLLMDNLRAMQAACDEAGVRLRPHGKMHKCSRIAQLQISGGAVGLCCQTIGEAEAFAVAGISNLLISAPIAGWAVDRVAAIAAMPHMRIAVVSDSSAQIERLSAAAVHADVEIGCLVDVNIGMHRVGCAVAEAPALARLITDREGLCYEGVQAYFGHLQHREQRSDATAADTAILATLVNDLTAAGLAPPHVTGGGTGTYALDLMSGVFTELQCGSYALMDAEYGACGSASGEWPFRPALHIVASVISAKHKTHVTVDLGLKATSLDVAPRIVSGAAPGSLWRPLGDEHGAVIHPAAPGVDVDAIDADPAFPWPTDAPAEGDFVWFQPGHCDPTINLYDAFLVLDEDGGTERWPIDARRVSR